MPRMIPELTEKNKRNFWKKVVKTDGCWGWTAAKSADGYGKIGFCGYKFLASRISWLLHHGKDPGEMLVCHKCDNPECTNPNHLFLGTSADNAHDRDVKGRQVALRGDDNPSRKNPSIMPRGEGHGMSKLTEQEVSEIRREYATCGFTYIELAVKFGVSKKTVLLVVNRRTWKHVP